VRPNGRPGNAGHDAAETATSLAKAPLAMAELRGIEIGTGHRGSPNPERPALPSQERRSAKIWRMPSNKPFGAVVAGRRASFKWPKR
jgi:hypothetical protein